MNPNRDLSYLNSIGGTLLVNGIATSAGTIDFSSVYEGRFSAVASFGSIHSGGSATAYVDYSTDGSAWSNLGSLVASPGSAGSNTNVVADYDSFTGRYLRTRLQGVGAGGTVTASVVIAAKPRTVTDG